MWINTLILGPTGSGKTEQLQQQYRQWLRSGIRPDQILVLTAGASQSSLWRASLQPETCGAVEVYGFYGFLQHELTLSWAPVQEQVPALRTWVRPEFLDTAIAWQLAQGLVEDRIGDFPDLKVSPARVAIQISGSLGTLTAGAGISPGEMTDRLAAAGGPESRQRYEAAASVLETYRNRCLQAGFLDYGLSLHLFTQVLLKHPVYLDQLSQRYRCLMVDDLDESTAIEQDWLTLLTPHMEAAVCAFGTDGGHGGSHGAEPALALARFRPGATLVELTGSHTCSAAAFACGEQLSARVLGESVAGSCGDLPITRITTDLYGEMVSRIGQTVAQLAESGLSMGEVVILAPRVDAVLEASLRHSLGARGIGMRSLNRVHRLIDEPPVRTIVALAGLVHPEWFQPASSLIPDVWGPGGISPGWVAEALQGLAGFDPVRASRVAGEVRQTGALPDPQAAARYGLTDTQGKAYSFLYLWTKRLEGREESGADRFVQAAVAEVLVPLLRDVPLETLALCQQLLLSVYRFRTAAERFGGTASFGQDYIRLLTDATVQADPARLADSTARQEAVLLATPGAYLTARLSAECQIWADIASDDWYANGVGELSNPYVLSRQWEGGQRWTDDANSRTRQANCARTVRALLRRCRGSLVLAECSLNAWGMEQEGGLAAVFDEISG